MGSWITYGLGSENQNLPGFIAMCPGGLPIVGSGTGGRLPARRLPGHLHRHAAHGVAQLIENIRRRRESRRRPAAQLDLLRRLNELHAAERRAMTPRSRRGIAVVRAGLPDADREAAEAFDIGREPEPIRAMYGSSTPRPGSA